MVGVGGGGVAILMTGKMKSKNKLYIHRYKAPNLKCLNEIITLYLWNSLSRTTKKMLIFCELALCQARTILQKEEMGSSIVRVCCVKSNI